LTAPLQSCSKISECSPTGTVGSVSSGFEEVQEADHDEEDESDTLALIDEEPETVDLDMLQAHSKSMEIQGVLLSNGLAARTK